MNEIELDQKGDLLIKPSKSSTQNDFDFLVGKWNIHNKKLVSRLTNSNDWIEFDAVQEMRKVLTGNGNVENISATVNNKPYEGMAIRLFNPATKLWSIYWADTISGTMDKPVIGSFENNVGTFFGRDIFEGKEILLQFKWNATDPENPVWSQAFSVDNGKTWEWNWFMHFTKRENGYKQDSNVNQNSKVIELRNYLIKPGQRDQFINYFEQNFIQSQNDLGGYILGQYRVKGAEDNFFWIRGFRDMPSRNKFLNEFYHGSFWKEHKNVPNSMLLNNDNVHLLRPLDFNNDQDEIEFNSNWFRKNKGIAVVDFYISNSKLDKLVSFVKEKYSAVLKSSGIENASYWISESIPNEFTALPVFQDKDLLVQISFFKDELEYQAKLKLAKSKMSNELEIEMADLVTVKNTLLIYPTEKSLE